MYGQIIEVDRVSPHCEASWSKVAVELVGFDADGERMLVDDARSIEVSLLLLLHLLCRTRVVEVGHPLPIAGNVYCWSDMKLFHTDDLAVIDEENEKLVNDVLIGELRVARVRVIDMGEEPYAIRVELALIAVILWWTETDARTIVNPDGNTAIARVEQKLGIR